MHRSFDALQDRLYHLDSAKTARHCDLGFGTERGFDYVASDWSSLRRMLKKTEIGESDCFLDVGAGKGRILFLAAQYPFRRVLGVELSDSLCGIARRNLAIHRDRLRCPNVEVIGADALEYAIPDDVTFLYMYNPFSGAAFGTFVERILESLSRRPRHLHLIYNNPVMHEHLVERGFELVVRSHFLASPPHPIYRYRAPALASSRRQ
ncbi:MAG TPA: class I SAM-dependent methyltransferase [Solirubrobacteraceae bacterium]